MPCAAWDVRAHLCSPQIVGWEGVFGVVGTLGIMAPVAYFLPGDEGEGVHENILDTVTVSGLPPAERRAGEARGTGGEYGAPLGRASGASARRRVACDGGNEPALGPRRVVAPCADAACQRGVPLLSCVRR